MKNFIFIWISFIVICNFANSTSVLPFAQGSRTKREAGENTEIDADNLPLEPSTSIQSLMHKIQLQLAEHADIIKQLNQRQENTQLEMAEFKDISKALRSLISDMGVDVRGRGMGETHEKMKKQFNKRLGKPSHIFHDNVVDIEAKWYQNRTIIQDLVDAQLLKVTAELDLLRDQNANQTSLIQSLQERMDSLHAEQLKLQTNLNKVKIGHQMETEEIDDHPANQNQVNTTITDLIQSESEHQNLTTIQRDNAVDDEIATETFGSSTPTLSPIELEGGNLTAVKVGLLPSGYSRYFAFHGGLDSKNIYLYGIHPEGSRILHFNITTSSLKHLGFIPGYLIHATLQSDNLGNIYLFGARTSVNSTHNATWKYNPEQNETSVVGEIEIPYMVWGSASVTTADGNILIFGGWWKNRNEILSFDTNTGDFTTLPNSTTSWSWADLRTSVRVGDKAFIFGSQLPPSSSFVKIDLQTFKEERISSSLPIFDSPLNSVYDGEYIYLHGGFYTKGPYSRGIIKFNPENYEWSYKNIELYPVGNEDGFWNDPPAMIFVKELKRIYFFGGLFYLKDLADVEYKNDIWYVDV